MVLQFLNRSLNRHRPSVQVVETSESNDGSSSSSPATPLQEKGRELCFVDRPVSKHSIRDALLKQTSWKSRVLPSKKKKSTEDLQKFSLVNCSILEAKAADKLEKVLREATQLQELRLVADGFMHCPETIALVLRLLKASSESTMMSLERLTFSTLGETLTAPVGVYLQQILMASPLLSEMHITSVTDRQEEMFQQVAQGLMGHSWMKMLSFTSCSMEDSGLQQLLASLLSLPKLKALDLSCNDLTNESLPLLTQLLERDCLEFLDISDQPIFDDKLVNNDHVYRFIEAVTMSQNLEYLSLQKCHLGDEAAAKLFAALADPRINLRQLDLGFNYLGVQAFRALIQHLPQMKSIIKLKIHGVRMHSRNIPWSSADGKMLLQALSQNQNVHCVSIDSNLFHKKEDFGTLEAVLRRNFLIGKTQKAMSNTQTDFPVALLPQVLERVYRTGGLERTPAHTVNHQIFEMVKYQWAPSLEAQGAAKAQA